MRSEKEGAAGPGAAVAARGPSGRERLSAVDVHFRRESPRPEPEAPPAASPGCGSCAGKPREEKRTALSKVVIRRLPPSFTKEQLEEQLCPLPAHDYFEFFSADLSLSPHLYSRAYINFRNPDDILLFRDRFDGYIFIDSKGLEYPAVVEFAPFQKAAKRRLKKKDARMGSIEDDPEYRKFLETYSAEEEKTSASPETLLGDIEAKTRELMARRSTPLLDFIRSRRLEKQRLRDERREERRRRDLERRRLREAEKGRRREADRQRRAADRDVRVQLLKKPGKREEPATGRRRDSAEDAGAGGSTGSPALRGAPRSPPGEPPERPQPCGGDQEQTDVERRSREKDLEPWRCCLAEAGRLGARREANRPSRRSEDDPKRGRGFTPDRGKRGGQDHGGPLEAAERPGGERSAEGPAPRKERVGNQDRPGLQLYRAGARGRAQDDGPDGAGGSGAVEGAGSAAPRKGDGAE